MPASSIPGYVQGYRFKNDPACWDGTRFIDQAGYGDAAALTITTGTPAFTTVSGQEGLTLDNTVQGEFLPPIPWEGSVIAVMKPNMGTNGTIYPVVVGANATTTQNGTLRLVRVGATDYRPTFATASGSISLAPSFPTNGIEIAAFSVSQLTRKGYHTKDAVTVTASSAVGAAANGNGIAPGYATGQTYAGHKARFGNLSGTLADTVATSNTMTIFELHYFKGVSLVDSLAAVKMFVDELKATYGV
jgi:hypothetical protein